MQEENPVCKRLYSLVKKIFFIRFHSCRRQRDRNQITFGRILCEYQTKSGGYLELYFWYESMIQAHITSAVHIKSIQWTIIWVLPFPKIVTTILILALKSLGPYFPISFFMFYLKVCSIMHNTLQQSRVWGRGRLSSQTKSANSFLGLDDNVQDTS